MNERARNAHRARCGAAALTILGSIACAVMPAPAHASPSPPHVMLIVEENAGYSAAQGDPSVIGNPSAPYINSLAGTYTSATHWYAVQHNSPHDYLDLIDGSDLGLPNGKPYSSPTLVDELHSNGIPWQAYMESMPSPCFSGNSTSDGLYDSNHNPLHFFTRYTTASGGWCDSAQAGSEGVVPYPGASGIASALDGPNAPDFALVVPNDCNEMHGDTNAGSPCAADTNDQLVSAGDSWLQTNLPPVLSSNWYASGGIIIITWDESANGDTSGGSYGTGGQIATLVISANSHSAFTVPGDHYATLRGIEEAYGVSLLNNSADPNFGDLTPAFGIPVSAPPPTVTGVSPTEGAEEGGGLVTISGTHFNGSGFTTSDVVFGTTDIPASNSFPCPGSSAGCFSVAGPNQINAFTPHAASPGTVDVTVVTPGGISVSHAADHYIYVAPGAYVAMTPFRICDTRSILPVNQCTGQTVGAKGTLTVQVTGDQNSLGQVVPSNAEAVAANLTAIDDGSAPTYVTAFPAGNSTPLASNINLSGHNAQANLAIVQLGTGGAISIYNAVGRADVIVDIQGYFAPPGAPPVAGAYHAMRPLRICDTRAQQRTECAGAVNNPIPANTWRDVVLSGLPPGATGPSIPSDGSAAAAVFNLTGTQGTASTYLSVEPPDARTGLCATAAPAVSNINLAAGTSLPNRVVAALGPHQDVCVYNSRGSINVIIDVDGWFGNGNETSTGALFYSLPPTRICDTRAGSATECQGQGLHTGTIELVQVAGVMVLPTAGGSPPPVAMVANLTGVGASASTYLTLFPSDVKSRPLASDLNPVAGATIANLAIVGLAATGGSAGDIDLYNAVGDINAILDVTGWFQ
ncbi:MAG TPA: alkaline phosphatase family protein [Candidatus Saccharimonadales bacterium]|nr:alkaline phosphatase family protein [Candidatus Saccharimonadales bacterium]